MLCLVLAVPMIPPVVLTMCLLAPGRARQWALAATVWLPFLIVVAATLAEVGHDLRPVWAPDPGCVERQGLEHCTDLSRHSRVGADLRRWLAGVGVPVSIHVAVLLYAALPPTVLLPAVIAATLGVVVGRPSPGVAAHLYLDALLWLLLLYGLWRFLDGISIMP